MSEIDEKTGLSREEWDVSIGRNGRPMAVWKNEEDYVITEIGDNRWSLVEAGESLGVFDTAVAAADAMPKLEFNPWEDMDGRNQSLYVKLAAKDFDEWSSGETDDLFLRRENGSWWLSEPGVVGQSEYPTRQRGMIAGLEVYQESYKHMNERIIKSLELDAHDWRVEINSSHVTATNVHDESVTIEANDNSSKWALFNGEDLVGDYKSAKDAADAVPVPAMTL